MKKGHILFICTVLLVVFLTAAFADRYPEEKPDNYLGAMRVVWCNEWISLREEPKKTSSRIAEIPLGEIVYSCIDINNTLFVQCEYHGMTGYALRGYLQPAPECEPPVSSAVSKRMTMEEIIGNGIVVLEWQDYNMSVVAAHEYNDENDEKWEILRIGCFIDDQPIWGHEEKLEADSNRNMLKAFIGGVEDDWQVMVFDGGYGLSMLDLLSGRERWSVTVKDCPLGDGAVFCVDDNGTIYLAGTDGPDPVAISADGRILWRSSTNDPEVYEPYEIKYENNLIQVKYRSGMKDGYKLVTIDNSGEVLSIRTQQSENAED